MAPNTTTPSDATGRCLSRSDATPNGTAISATSSESLSTESFPESALESAVESPVESLEEKTTEEETLDAQSLEDQSLQQTMKDLLSETVKLLPAPEKPVWVDRYSYTGYEIIWLNAISITLFHVLAFILFFVVYPYTQWKTGIWAFVIGIAGGFGVTGGVHRLWTHRSYKATAPLRIILMLCFAMSGQNSIYDWVRDHRVHHKFSETDADPHNVNRGFFFAHVGWLMKRKHPEVRRRGQQMDMSDIKKDPVAAFQIKYHTPLKLLMCFMIPISVPVYFWCENWSSSIVILGLVRYMCNLNFTWLVNSAAHMFGNKPYNRSIAPVENRAVSIVALGEGWHNYHHVFPWDYKAAELAHINLTLHLLNWFARIGWAYDLKVASPKLVDRVARRYGDGSRDTAPEIPEDALTDNALLEELLKEKNA